MSGLLMQVLIVFVFFPEAGKTAISSGGALKYTAQQLIEKIVESEYRIEDVQADYLFFEPDTNLPLLYAHWAYQPDKELIAGLQFKRAGSNLEYSISTKSIFSLDGERRFYNYREEIEEKSRQLLIRPAELFDLDTFRVYMTPNSLLGFDISCGSRRSFGLSLQQAPKAILKKRTEQIDGRDCYVLEAVGIENPEFSYDVRAWIDTGRDFRPLKVDIFYNNLGGRQYPPFERLSRRIYDIKLRRIDGIWFPVEGRRDNFAYEQVLPPELEGLTEEQARQKFSPQELEGMARKVKEVAVLSVPTRKTIVDIDSVRLNQGIEPGKFVLKPPPGCNVRDEIEDRNYTVKDGDGFHLPLEVSFLELKRFAPPEFMKVIYPDTLIGCRLQDVNQFKISLDSDQFKDKPLLLCIWDIQQRPSRAFVKELAANSASLGRQGPVVICIQASKVNEDELEELAAKNGISFRLIISETNEQQTQFRWAAKSLPWLILTDKEHIITAEGFALGELDERIESSSSTGSTDRFSPDDLASVRESFRAMSEQLARYHIEYRADKYPIDEKYFPGQNIENAIKAEDPESPVLGSLIKAMRQSYSKDIELDVFDSCYVCRELSYALQDSQRLNLKGEGISSTDGDKNYAYWPQEKQGTIATDDAGRAVPVNPFTIYMDVVAILADQGRFKLVSAVPTSQEGQADAPARTCWLAEFRDTQAVHGYRSNQLLIDVSDNCILRNRVFAGNSADEKWLQEEWLFEGFGTHQLGGANLRLPSRTVKGSHLVQGTGLNDEQVIFCEKMTYSLKHLGPARITEKSDFAYRFPVDTEVWVKDEDYSYFAKGDGQIPPKHPPSLVGQPLPDLKGLGLDLPSSETQQRMLLVCLFDMDQRPSRRCVLQLAKQAAQLQEKGVTVVGIQVSKVDANKLNEWVKENHIPFPVGMVRGDEEKTRFAWGVRSLPWLILADSKHIIRAEGFGISELNQKMGEMADAQR